MTHKNKNVIFLVKDRLATDHFSIYPGDKNEQFRVAYKELIDEFEKLDAQVFFALPSDLDADGTFRRLFALSGDTDPDESLVMRQTSVDDFIPRLLINRSKDQLYQNAGYNALVKAGVCVVNPKQIAELGDKVKSLVKISKFLPETIVLDEVDKESRLNKIGEFMRLHGTVVFKPQRSNGGRGIVISDDIDSDDVQYVASTSDVYVVQQYVENESGIPGLVEGRHDVRLYIVGGNIIAASIRQPQPGSLLSNTSQGGTIDFYTKDKLPTDLLGLGESITSELDLPGASFVSLDFFYSGIRWYLIEVNDQPGIPARYQNMQVATNIQKALAITYNEELR